MQVDSGPVVFRIAGKNADGSDMAMPIDLTGGAIIGNSFKPQNLQFVYGGTGDDQDERRQRRRRR